MADPYLVVVDDEAGSLDELLGPVLDVVDGEVIDSRELDSDVNLDLLRRADLILVDHQMRELQNVKPPSASNGLALIPVLREFLADQGRRPSFVLFSSQLSSLSDLPQEARAHILARTHNFEWALSKGADNPVALFEAIPALVEGSLRVESAFARAYDDLDDDDGGLDEPERLDDAKPIEEPREVTDRPATPAADQDLQKPVDAPDPQDQPMRGPAELRPLHSVLGLPAADWAPEALRQVELARPPIYSPHGDLTPVAVRRWLLQRVIPYPTFVHGVEQIAARLALPVDTTRDLLEAELKPVFAPAAYTGAYAELDGARYWRVGADVVISDTLHGDDVDTLRTELQRLAGRDLPFVDSPRPVIVLGANWRPERMPVSPSEAVRVQLDDWPAHAEPARVSLLRATEPDVAPMVVEADRERLPGLRSQ